MSSYLGQKGYTIYKESLDVKEQILIRKELEVSPWVPKSSFHKPPSFPIYRESKGKLYLPRFYGIENYGEPEEIRLAEGEDIDVTFKGDLRPKQVPAVEAFLNSPSGCGLLELCCGFGKCLAKNTPIMLYNGKMKMVQDIKVGDKLMGDDSTPRTVLSLARGREMMYKVIPKKGDSYTVNESHILSLKCSSTYSKKFKKGQIVDICVKDYLNLPKTFHGPAGALLGYRVPIIFPEKQIDIDPYVLGYWLGDGHSRNTGITTIEEPVIEYFTRYANNLGLHIRKNDSNGTRCPSYFITAGKGGRRGGNILLNWLKKYNLIQNKHIPHDYKCNSRKNQLELLAGIIDSDGYTSHGGCEIIQKREKLLDDIIFVARSLGFAAYKKECQKSCMYKGEKKTGTYYRTTIHGKGLEEIPVKCPRKKVAPRKQIKDALVTRIKLEKQEVDDYYGFTIDGNHRFILGDFQVTHNTVCALKIIAELKKKTLVIVHKSFLMNQWKERIEQFLPGARVGIIQGETIDTEDKDIVLGMLQSISMKEYPWSLFQEFGLTIMDECFPYNTYIHTESGAIRIGTLYEKFKNKEKLPNILSFNQETKSFEYKKMTYAWRKEREDLIKIKMSKKVINCTPEHKILTTKGYVKANNLVIGDLIMSKYDSNHKDNIISKALNDDQKQIVYGSYLGDGHIAITKKNRYRLQFTHGEKQKEYCLWKANMFGIKKICYIEKNGYSQKPAYRFATKIFDLEDTIIKNTKIVPDWLLDKLDERGIAIWFMDDGSLAAKRNSASIHSNNFDFAIQEKFVNKFKEYNIDCKILKTRKYYYLQFNKENTKRLIMLIAPYIHNCLAYKCFGETVRKYEWNKEFLNYGLLRVTNIIYFKNKGANRRKTPYVYDIEVADNHNFVIGTKTGSKQIDYIDGPIVSNCHHISAEVFSRSLFKIVTKHMLGLSATMKRKDGLTRVFKMFLGDVVYKKERENANVTVKVIKYDNNDEEYSQDILNYRGQIFYAKMINKLCDFNLRSEFILKVLSDLLVERKGQQIMILAHNKSLLKYLYDAIEHRNMATVGYYVGGMKEKDLKITETKQIVIATYAMASEGLDIKTLTTLILATPKTDVTQAVGRILRRQEVDALVIDILDQHGIFHRQWLKRRAFYKKSNFKIMLTDNKDYFENKWNTFQKKRKKGKKKIIKPCLIKD
jgi:superfamily II DNA or RNA helicase